MFFYLCHKYYYSHEYLCSIILEKPGIIELKKPCRAYDYVYVECELHAPVIARGFQNGFRELFDFTELTTKYVCTFRDIINDFVLFIVNDSMIAYRN